jgi:glycosyltransferase involved in cell wall biosynthesis
MGRYVFLIPDYGKSPRGGIMNIVRHCALAAKLGADAVLATDSGKDPHGRRWFRHDIPVIKWGKRKADDTCVIPDLFSDRVATVEGPCVVYMQTPIRLYRNFDFARKDLQIWTDSPVMLEKCNRLYPGKEIPIVPNIVDNELFPFVPQAEREPGMIIVFPRKGDDFIRDVFDEYRRSGGRYWKPKFVDGLRLGKMALIFRRAQAFLASADVEGCALPPQESMAGGVVVVGKNASGANFCMRHKETAMVADTAGQTAACLREVEDTFLREELAANAYRVIRRYFPEAEPTAFWQNILGRTGVCS